MGWNGLTGWTSRYNEWDGFKGLGGSNEWFEKDGIDGDDAMDVMDERMVG